MARENETPNPAAPLDGRSPVRFPRPVSAKHPVGLEGGSAGLLAIESTRPAGPHHGFLDHMDTARRNRNLETESWQDRIIIGRIIRAESWEEEGLRYPPGKSCSNCMIFSDSTAKRQSGALVT
jgi:hypothetical protein